MGEKLLLIISLPVELQVCMNVCLEAGIKCQYLCVLYLLDTNDYSSRSGHVTITEDVQFQCVSIPIRNDNIRESSYECFTFQISAVSTIDGLSVEPSEASICIIDRNCELQMYTDFNRLYNVHTLSQCAFTHYCYYIIVHMLITSYL